MNSRKQVFWILLMLMGAIPFLLPKEKNTVERTVEANTLAFSADHFATPSQPAASSPPATPSQPEKLTSRQQEILHKLEQYLSTNQLAQATILLLEHETEILEMFAQNQEEHSFFMSAGLLEDHIEGQGVVLTKTNTVFYGEFSAGRPAGVVTALLPLALEQLRYDYAIGIWENGTMNGYGEIGYEYFDESTLQVTTSVRKIGYFYDDVMDGQVYYSSRQDIERYSWQIQVREGLLQIDDRWEDLEAEGKYRLPSDEDPGHVYAVFKDEVDIIQWRNMIRWNPDQNN